MITLLGALLGFLTSTVPDAFRLFNESKDRQHELRILEMQLQQQQQSRSERLEDIQTYADAMQSKALYRTYYSGVKWVDALNGTVRPVLAYAFFLLYAGIKLAAFMAFEPTEYMPFSAMYHVLWTQEDAAIFAGIMSFYFGQRAMRKIMK